VLRYLPETPENESLSLRLGKEQFVLDADERGVFVTSRPSSATYLNDNELRFDEPVPLRAGVHKLTAASVGLELLLDVVPARKGDGPHRRRITLEATAWRRRSRDDRT
jgi:hypothetical protein